MSGRRWTGMAAALVAVPVMAAAGLSPRAATAQELGRRIEGGGDGMVRFSIPTRPEVEICDQGIRMGEHRMWWRSHGEYDYASDCRFGPVEVEARVRDGSVRGLEVVRSPRDRTAGARELGTVGAGEAVAWLTAVARGGASDRAARDAVFPMVLADVPDVWRALMELARDRGVPSEARKNALFWVGQEAAEAVTGGLSDVALDEDEDQEVRDAAVFAISQRPRDEAVPVLMEVARTAHEGRTRRTAMFWLAQSDDPRVLPFFERILLGREGG
jgi:hypothetical protein